MDRSFSRITCWLIFLLFFNLSAATPLFAQNFLVQISNNRLTLKTDKIPLQQVLREIEKQSGITMQLFLKPDDLVTAELNNIPLKKGLGLLLQRYNNAISYETNAQDISAITNIFVHSHLTIKDEPLQVQQSQPQGYRGNISSFSPQEPTPGKLALHNTNPLDNDPLNSMRGIDPLARFNHNPHSHDPNSARPSFLPFPL